METLIFDVMCNGRFVMQVKYKYCPAFRIDFDKIMNEVLEKRPTLKGKKIELYQTNNVVR